MTLVFEGTTVTQHRPYDPCQLGGECDDHNVGVSPGEQLAYPPIRVGVLAKCVRAARAPWINYAARHVGKSKLKRAPRRAESLSARKLPP